MGLSDDFNHFLLDQLVKEFPLTSYASFWLRVTTDKLSLIHCEEDSACVTSQIQSEEVR